MHYLGKKSRSSNNLMEEEKKAEDSHETKIDFGLLVEEANDAEIEQNRMTVKALREHTLTTTATNSNTGSSKSPNSQ